MSEWKGKYSDRQKQTNGKAGNVERGVDRSEEDVECSCEQFDRESVLAAGVCTCVQM